MWVVVVDSPVSGSVLCVWIDARSAALNPERTVVPAKVVVALMWLIPVRMDWAWSMLASR